MIMTKFVQIMCVGFEAGKYIPQLIGRFMIEIAMNNGAWAIFMLKANFEVLYFMIFLITFPGEWAGGCKFRLLIVVDAAASRTPCLSLNTASVWT